MSFSSRTIAKNTGVLLASQLITWGLSFLLSIIQPRCLGPTAIGQLELAASLWTIVGVIAALGTDLLITKEIARSPERLNELIGTALALRAMIFVFCALGMVAYVLLVGYTPQTAIVIFIVGTSYMVGQLSSTYDAALKGLERMEYTALAGIVSSLLLTVLIIGLLLLGYGVFVIAALGIVARTTGLAIEVYFLSKNYAIKLSVNWRLMIPVLKASMPFFLVTVGIILYHQVDTVIISLLVDEASIGWYGTADHLYGSLLFIPNVFITALFPVLSRAHKETPNASRMLAQKSLNLLVLVSVPLGWGISVIANQFVVLLFGPSFANSGPVLAIRGIFLILTFVNMLVGFLLISLDRQKAWAYVIMIATLATIPLDLFLIPWTVRTFANGALGGALSFAFTEIGMTTAGFVLLPKDYFLWKNTGPVIKLILAGLVMVGAAWFWRNTFILIPVIIGAVTYIGMVILLRALPDEDWNFIMGTARSVFHRVRGRFFKTVELEG
jgi:O-antigen/teichoic acid export membrane protein